MDGLGVGRADIIWSLLRVDEMVVQLSYDIQSPEGYHHLDSITAIIQGIVTPVKRVCKPLIYKGYFQDYSTRPHQFDYS